MLYPYLKQQNSLLAHLSRFARSLSFIFLSLIVAACGGGGGGGGGGNPPQNQAPIAVMSVTPSDGKAPLEVVLDASASNDPDGTIQSYSWSLDDGSSDVSGETVTHTIKASDSMPLLLFKFLRRRHNFYKFLYVCCMDPWMSPAYVS